MSGKPSAGIAGVSPLSVLKVRCCSFLLSWSLSSSWSFAETGSPVTPLYAGFSPLGRRS